MIKVGIIGTGAWGENFVRIFNNLPRSRVEYLCDSNSKRLEQVARKYRLTRVTTSYRDVLASPEVRGVVIALPASLHYAVAREALQAGKHVLVEKPMALSSRHCRSLVRHAERRSLVLMVGHTFDYNPSVREIRRRIARGELGKIYYITSQRLNLGVVRKDVNALWNFAPHDLSILLTCLPEPPSHVMARGLARLQPGIEDMVSLLLDYPDGKMAHVLCSWLNPEKVRRMVFVGSRRMLVYDDTLGDEAIRIYDKGIDRQNISERFSSDGDFGKFQLIKRAGEVRIPKVKRVEPLAEEAAHFLRCLRTGRQPRSDGEAGLKVVRILEAAQRSLRANGKRIRLSQQT